LVVPADAGGLVLLAVTVPNGAKGPRVSYLSRLMRTAGLATAVCELLGDAPYERDASRPELLSARIVAWLDVLESRAPGLPRGLVGFEAAGTAALLAAAQRAQVRAVAAISGRSELPPGVHDLRVPALLVAGERDLQAIRDNQR